MNSIIVRAGWPWIIGSLVILAAPGLVFLAMGWGGAPLWFAAALLASGFMLFFFRNPHRNIVPGDDLIPAGADGRIRAVERLPENTFLQCEAVRISIFLSPFNVHVNRMPIAGQVKHLAYHRGRHLLTLDNRSSEENQHSSVGVEGCRTRCLIKQIVGPIVRRVEYWLENEQIVDKGFVFGMMKFGSRLDMYFPANDVEVLVSKGDVVRAGVTVVARYTSKNEVQS